MATPRLAESRSRQLSDSPSRGSSWRVGPNQNVSDSPTRRVWKSMTRRVGESMTRRVGFWMFKRKLGESEGRGLPDSPSRGPSQTKSKRFAFVPILRGPNQNVLLWSFSFWIKYKRSNLLKTTSRQIKLLCSVPEFLSQNGNDLLARKLFCYQIEMFCFRSDNKRTKSKHFASIY